MKAHIARLTSALAVFAMTLACSLPVAAAEVAGHFQFVIGDVQVRSGNVLRPARMGEAVREGETIVSGPNGEAQLRMVDDAYVAIRRNTELRVDEYRFSGKGDASERGVLSLVKGTFRALTGMIVRNNRQNFTMRTAVSTIGIRGTGNITHHNPDTNVTTNHTVTGSHGVTSVDPAGQPIGPTIETKPGVTVQVQPGQPPVVIPTPTFILAEASKDPKEQPAADEKKADKPAPRTEASVKAEQETREATAEAPKEAAPPPPPAAPAASAAVTAPPAPPPPSTAEQQLLQANLRTQIEGTYLQALSAYQSLATSVQIAQTSATTASTAASSTSALAPVDLTTVDTKIASASSLVAFAPSIQSSVTSAQNARATAFNAAGLGNPSSTLATAQSTATTAAATAAAQVSPALAAQTAGTTAYNAALAAYQGALAALDAGDIALAQQLLETLRTQADLTTAAAGNAATAASTAAAAASTAQNALTTGNNAVSTATSSASSAIAFADTAINTALGNINAIQQAANTSATNAANSVATIQKLQTAVGTVNTDISAISTVDTGPAIAAIGSATTAIGNASSGATQAVNSANALSLTSAQTTATANANTATTLQTTATGQVTNATNVHNANANVANGVGGTDFRDVTAIAAKTAMDAAKNALDAAHAAVQSAKTTVDTQAATLASQQSAATTALANANTALTTANTALTTVNTGNTAITNAKNTVTTSLNTVNTQLSIAQSAAGSGTTTLDPNPTVANSTVAANCGSALACSDLATQYVNAAIAATPGSPEQANASNNALTAQGRAATFEQTAAQAVTTAQTAANTASAQLPVAQSAFTAASNAANTATTSAGTAQTQATAASTAASNAQAAATAGNTAATNSTAQLATVQNNATTVAEQAIIAQYSNPIIVTPNRFTSVGVAPNRLGTNSNERFQHYAVKRPNTNFVLSGEKSLVESRVTDSISNDQRGTFNPVINNGDLTVVGGTPSDIFVSSSNAPGAENYVALGRVTGGLLQSDGVTIADLGSGAGARSFHWIVGYEPPAGYTAATKLTGTTTYTRIANTSPTDSLGNVGTLNSATLSVDFTAQQVNAGVNATVAGRTYAATTGTAPVPLGVAGPGTPQFGGPFQTVSCTGTGCSGTYGGDLTGSLTGALANGAGLVYSLFPLTTAGSPYTDLIQGAVAFQAATPPALIPQPAANIVTAYLYSSGTFSVTAFEASSTTYTMDAGDNLIAVAEAPHNGDLSQTISGGTALARGQVTSAGGSVIDFGRWQGSSVSGVDFNGAFNNRTVEGIYHWMKGPAIAPFYLPGALTGTVSYTAQGGTVSDQAGTAGTLDLVNTTLSVNFTQQSVAADIRATTAAGNWQGLGTGIRIDGGGLFFAHTGGASPHNNLSVLLNGSATGTFGAIDGALMGNGVDAAGVAFAFGQGSNRAVGAVAFTGTAQSTPNIVSGMVAAGKIGAPLTATGAATGAPALATLDPELVTAVQPIVMNATRVSRDGAAAPQVIRFDGEVPIAYPTSCTSTCNISHTPAVFSLRDATFPFDSPPGPGAPALPTTLTNTGSDSATGITWGRYVGYVSYTDRITGTAINPAVASGAFDVRTSNWHGIWSSTTSAPVLPSSGTINYTAVGGTFASDSLGNVAVNPTTATLSANFTNMTVNTTVNAVVGPNTWAASASNVPIVNGTYFQAQRLNGAGNLSVTMNGSATGTSGNVTGIFVGNAATGTNGGAMLGYSLNQGGAAGVTMQGVTAFRKP
jgi:hypothetical protein